MHLILSQPHLLFSNPGHPLQIGGFTLTSTIIYLSLNLHQRNRLYQASLLRQQALVLNRVVEPLPPAPPSTAREVRAGLGERVKDRWNQELEENVRKLQALDWNQLRGSAEERVSAVWRRAFEGTREALPEAK